MLSRKVSNVATQLRVCIDYTLGHSVTQPASDYVTAGWISVWNKSTTQTPIGWMHVALCRTILTYNNYVLLTINKKIIFSKNS